MNWWSIRVLAAFAVAAFAVAATLAGCGGTTEPPTGGPSGTYPVQVRASFPSQQKLAEQTELILAIRNAGSATIPNVAVTLTNPRYGTSAQALGTLIPPNQQGQPILASRSRPIWIIDQAPGPCSYSCRHLGPGAGATAYSNTWALGRLAPGQTVTFDWHVTAVQPGEYEVRYRVAPALTGSAHATTTGGGAAGGLLRVRIAGTPRHAWVKNDGQVVYSG